MQLEVLIGHIGRPNVNGVEYSEAFVKKIQKRIKERGPMLAEYGNPDISNLRSVKEAYRRMATIDHDNVAAHITDIYVKDKDVYLSVNLINHEESPVEFSVRFGIRAMGPFREDSEGNRVYDMDEQKIITWDYLLG